MGSSAAKRRLIIHVSLIGCALAVCGWQVEEHLRFESAAEQALINRGRDITSTLGVVVRAQRRFGLVAKDRLQSALQDLVHPADLESIAILGATGETIASAGKPIEITPEMLHARGVYRRGGTLTIMNVMDLGTADGGITSPAAVVVNDLGPFRRGGRRTGERNASGTPSSGSGAHPPAVRPPFSRPSWMSPEEYNTIIQKQGVHSLVLSLSTADMRRAVNDDLLLRSLVSLLACGGAIISSLALRNFQKNADLQIRLVKAGEMNTHLKEMNLAAAGLAHETRNPLNLIRGLAQMIAMQAKESPKLQEHAATIVEEADRVTVQLNEFINYSKPREAHLAPVVVSRLVADVARTLVPDLEEKAIQLQQPDSPLAIEADESLLRQALFNLLLNAVQAVEHGGKIEIRLAATGPREAALEIADNGPGVPEAERVNIFKPYVTMRFNGVGLGLAIVQQIVSVHHWDIACTANSPRGALFRIRHLKIA